MIHTTIGIYPNGEYKTNGVLSDHLAMHIWYNVTHRPGRALAVDGYLIYAGCAKHDSDTYKMYIETLEKLKTVKHHKDTAPYQ